MSILQPLKKIIFFSRIIAESFLNFVCILTCMKQLNKSLCELNCKAKLLIIIRFGLFVGF